MPGETRRVDGTLQIIGVGSVSRYLSIWGVKANEVKLLRQFNFQLEQTTRIDIWSYPSSSSIQMFQRDVAEDGLHPCELPISIT